MGDFQQQREAGAGRPDNELSSTLLMLPEGLTSHIPEDKNDEPETTDFQQQREAGAGIPDNELSRTDSYKQLHKALAESRVYLYSALGSRA